MECILKFFENKERKDEGNAVISRTLLKIAVVSKYYSAKPGNPLPKPGEFWRCKIVKEMQSGKG